jgi:hypothetical protein
MDKVKCLVADGQNLDGIYAGGSFAEGEEVELHPDVAKFYEEAGIVVIVDAAKPEVVDSEFGG